MSAWNYCNSGFLRDTRHKAEEVDSRAFTSSSLGPSAARLWAQEEKRPMARRSPKRAGACKDRRFLKEDPCAHSEVGKAETILVCILSRDPACTRQ